MGQDSAVGIATCYRLDGPGIETRWGARFSLPLQTGPGALSASYTMDTGSFPWIKWPGRGIDHSPLCSTQVKERAELLPLWNFMTCSRVLYFGNKMN